MGSGHPVKDPNAPEPDDPPLHQVNQWPPEVLGAVLLVEFAALVYLFLAWQQEWIGLTHDEWPAVIGIFPIAVPWAAALGGVTAGLVGLASHWSDFVYPKTREWQRRHWSAWYLFRMPVGTALGSAGAMILVLVTATVGRTSEGEPDISASGQTLLAVIAFAIAFRQHSFQRLLDNLFDAVLGEDDEKNAPGSDADTGVSAARRPARPRPSGRGRSRFQRGRTPSKRPGTPGPTGTTPS